MNAHPYLESIYGAERAVEIAPRVEALIEAYRRRPTQGPTAATQILITYGDMVKAEGEAPLRTLGRFLDDRLEGAIDTVHILPFAPWSSDDGFSVIDYRAVDPTLGGWGDVEALAERFNLMADLVLNHCSSESAYFQQLLRGEAPGRDFFVTANPAADVSGVVRPRAHPLLTRVETAEGPRHVWTTFSADQVDLDFGNPEVLLEMLDVLLYLTQRGAKIIRLDAIAYLWKRLGTPCIHLPETHAVVKLMRAVLEEATPGVQIITETNVPHAENVSYFGDGDEAHMVYQFSLPPLLLYGLHAQDPSALRAWARALPELPEGCTWFNFTASHDGVGLRPLEGLISDADRDEMLEAMRARGALVNERALPDGRRSPYELNVTYFDALGDGPGPVTQGHIDRFLLSQTLTLSLKGVPAVYFHSLMGGRNASEAVERLGYRRAINRARWEDAALRAALDDPQDHHARVFDAYTARLRLRAAQPAFDPAATQEILDLGEGIFALAREGGGQRIIAAYNFTDRPLALAVEGHDLLSDAPFGGQLSPFGCAWIE